MNFDFKFYWRLLLRRLPAMMALFLCCTVIGAIMAERLPTTYRTNARLLVEGAQIPGDLATSVVRLNANETIEIIRQRLLTRANLLEIADDTNVFRNYSSLSPDTIVRNMRQGTRINSRGGGRGQPLIVTVSFEGRSGRVAADVVNEYVTRIINANVELRTGRAENTLTFFEQEVDRLAGELDLQNARITQFQVENADALPDNLSFRLNRQSLLQERVANAERERASLADQRARIIAVYQATGQIAGGADTAQTPKQRQLQSLESELTNALTVYSETNPRVVTLRRRIEVLRGEIATESGAAVDTQDNTQQSLLDIQLSQIDGQLQTIETSISEAETELVELEKSIAGTPLNAITLRGLQRDLDNIRRQYDNAVASLAEASTGERIELSSRGQRITLIENATVPRSPASPNRPLIIAMGAGIGAGLAGALFILLELLNRSVRRPVEISSKLGITPLATIPYIEDPLRQLARRSLRIASLIVVIIGVPAALWALDSYYMPLDLLAERILGRLGLA